MEGIKKATTMELIAELMQRDDCYITAWMEGDTLDSFERYDVDEPTPDEIAEVWRTLDGWLEDRMCQVGWDVVDEAVRMTFCQGR